MTTSFDWRKEFKWKYRVRGIENRKEWVGNWMKRSKGSQSKTRYDNVKTDESCSPQFGVSFEKRSHARRAAVKTRPAIKYVWRTTENQKENSRSVSALFLLVTCFSSSSKRSRFSFDTLLFCFFLPDDYLKSVVENELLHWRTRKEFCIFFPFSDKHSRRSATRITSFATRWYKCLCVEVEVVQMSIETASALTSIWTL